MRTAPLGQCERWAWRATRHYVAGTTPDAAFDLARDLGRSGVGASIDQFGELVDEPAVAESVATDYLATRLATTVPAARHRYAWYARARRTSSS